MQTKVLLLLLLTMPLLAQEQQDPCVVTAEQGWKVVFNQEMTPDMLQQEIVPVVDYEYMIGTAQQQSYLAEEQRQQLVGALTRVGEQYPQYNGQAFRVFKIGVHTNPACKQIAVQAEPFQPPAPTPNPVEQQVAVKIAEAIPQVIASQFQQQANLAQQQPSIAAVQTQQRNCGSKLKGLLGIGGVGLAMTVAGPYGALGIPSAISGFIDSFGCHETDEWQRAATGSGKRKAVKPTKLKLGDNAADLFDSL